MMMKSRNLFKKMVFLSIQNKIIRPQRERISAMKRIQIDDPDMIFLVTQCLTELKGKNLGASALGFLNDLENTQACCL